MKNHNEKQVYIVCVPEEDGETKTLIPIKVFVDSRLAEEFKDRLVEKGVKEAIVDDTCQLDESFKRK